MIRGGGLSRLTIPRPRLLAASSFSVRESRRCPGRVGRSGTVQALARLEPKSSATALRQASAAERPIALPPVSERSMPITPFLDGHKFDPETKRIMGLAFEMALVALRLSDRSDLVNEAVAQKIIALRRLANAIPKDCATAH
jgi:hypothetical protein